ncbi:UNVERIFIED_CONTAM: protein tesmin/TSO1-like CXC 2 [Sesamum angustifolium]|uniref:Protein tesmin/TSO1-like CXC 2 n=1 Tax=Sesamum angustifolium TaxID=2727405 RepID=A0AAW2MHB2_9LAMI
MNSTIKIPKPSGIGLHLNSIVNAVQAGSTAVVHVKSAQRGNFSIRGKKSVPIINSHLSDNSISSSVFSPPENVSASTDDKRCESLASPAANSAASLSTYIVKPSDNSILDPVEDQSTPVTVIALPLGYTVGRVVLARGAITERNMRIRFLRHGNKLNPGIPLHSLLKLYSRSASHQQPVVGKMELYSRHPQQGTKEGAIARSPCVSKSTSNVGCSDGCRCEGCKNVYGRKGEYSMIKDVLSVEGSGERKEGSFTEQIMAPGNGFSQTELCNPHNLTPLTPAVQFPDHRKDASKAWIHSGKYFQSPESSLTFVAPYMMSPGSPRNSENNGMISGNTPGILDLVSPDQGLYYGNAEMGNEYSTVSDQSGKMENLSSVPNAKEWASQSFSGNKSYSSVSSLRWRGSPNTPTAQFSGHKPLQVIELESDFSNSLQDDTPDILKDSPIPLNAVKVSSPNKKRVSPPHGRQHEFSSSSSDGLRTGRKFILKAVPSFPPLTPCIDSKSGVAEQKNDPQSCSHNK